LYRGPTEQAAGHDEQLNLLCTFATLAVPHVNIADVSEDDVDAALDER